MMWRWGGVLGVLAVFGCAHHQVHGNHGFEDAQRWAEEFEAPTRDAWQMPDQLLDALAFPASAVVADVGSATGYFPVRIASRVPEGRVWAVDVEPNMVRYLNRRARREGINNLYSVLGLPDDPMLPEAVDVVLIVNTYHHIGRRTAYLRGLRPWLNPGASVVVVDFRPGKLPIGPPDAMKLAPDVVTQEFGAAGYAQTATHSFLPYQYVLVFQMNARDDL